MRTVKANLLLQAMNGILLNARFITSLLLLASSTRVFTFQSAADAPVVYTALKDLSFARAASREPVAPGVDSLEPAFRLVRGAVERGEVPGAIALVARGGKILRQEAWGLRDIENQLPFTT